MYRRSVLSAGAVLTASVTAGCFADSSRAEITVVDGYVERENDVFETMLELERTGSGGTYEIFVRIDDGTGNIFSFDRIHGDVSEEVRRSTESAQTTPPDEMGEIDDEYDATATVFEEATPIEEFDLETR
ncbi:hypothetical protein [Natrarchaeobius chitinivorans]|uniref:Uncharacterized protein n=1 Tax=Natrarchaeobius chitinivorans TaxID=1679083 RepID=A0A3N6M9E8_NATCH|nr:hypothetical protein [Natrarchaeobius chitinivorans]RQG97264.1 hypothetical protein EA473_04135 [Natrarchaeobius chitinivorans]